MPGCENIKHEEFAQLVAIGINATDAYRKIYGVEGNTAMAAASRLKKKLNSRITEIAKGVNIELAQRNEAQVKKGLAPLYLTKERSLHLLTMIAETPIGEIDENSPLCQAIEYRTTPGNREREGFETIKVKMPDKIRAIELHARLMGWLEAEGKQTVNVLNVAVVTEEKRKTIMERRRAALEIKDAV